MTTALQEQLPTHQYGQSNHWASSRYEFSTSSKKPHPTDSFTSVTLDRLRSNANGCAGNRIQTLVIAPAAGKKRTFRGALMLKTGLLASKAAADL